MLTLIDTTDKLNQAIPTIQQADIIGFDVEGSSLDPYTATLLLIQIATRENTYVINVGRVSHDTLRYLLNIIEDSGMLVIGHNVKYDMKMVYHNFQVLFTTVFDTMIAEVIQYAGIAKPFNSLAFVTRKHLGVELDKDTRSEFIGKTDFVFTEEQINYAGQDTQYLIPIMEKQSHLLERNQGEKVWTLEQYVEPVVAMMEYTGVYMDSVEWTALAEKARKKADEYDVKINTYLAENFDKFAGVYENALDVLTNICYPVKSKLRKADKLKYESIVIRDEIIGVVVPLINMNSHKQSLHVLQSLGVATKSTNQKELQKFKSHDFIKLLFNFRRYIKAGTAFGEEFLNAINPVTGRVHSNFEQARAATGRFGSNGPNLQNIKAEVKYRSCFEATDGYRFATPDYSQIELRIMAEISEEPLMIEAFNEGIDLHTLTASLIFECPLDAVTPKMRGIGKSVNFAVIYGTTEWGLQRNFGWPLETGRSYLDKYFKNYSVLEQFIREIGNRVLATGYSTTLYGRKRYFTVPLKPTWHDRARLSKIRRQGVNHVIQGSSADMMKMAMCGLFYDNPFDKDFRNPVNFRLLLTVHDEIGLEFKIGLEKDAEVFIKEQMTRAAEYFLTTVPVGEFDVKIGDCWRKE